MKNSILLFAIAITGFVTAQNVYIPDPNFKHALVNHHLIYEIEDEYGNDIPADVIDLDGDGEISIEEAEAFTGELYCFFQNISDLTGIEAFPNIKWLICSENNLTALDLSNNLALEALDCSYNFQLSNLDLSNHTALKFLDCSVNFQISDLDLSNNLALEILDCSYNQLATLDLSNHTNLIGFACVYNQLTYLNVKNGNNQNFMQDEDTLAYLFFTEGNPFLACIEVDDATWSTQNWINIDAFTSFSEDCVEFLTTNKNAMLKDLVIYPNPTNDFLNIKSDETTIENVKIYDIKGALLYENKNNENQINIDLSDFTAGIYFLKINYPYGETTHKIIRN